MACCNIGWKQLGFFLGIYPFTGRDSKESETFKYLGSTLSEDGELDAEVTHRVQNGWKNGKIMCGESYDREHEREYPRGSSVYRTLVRPVRID